jgi:predicted esterase YcpF (UPF0227 family)
MSEAAPVVLYLHGFNSSPDSRKAQQFKSFCESRSRASVVVPALPPHPAAAMALLRRLVADSRPQLLVGSSLGGFYATALAEAFGLKAVLVNPAVEPCKHLGEAFIGPQRNLYTGEEWEFTRADAAALLAMTLPALQHPERFLVLLQTADEVLDYRHAVDYYRGAELRVQEGGSHAYDDFAAVLPEICAFGGLQLVEPNEHQ